MTENNTFDSLTIAKELFNETKENYIKTNDKKFLKEMQLQLKNIERLEKRQRKPENKKDKIIYTSNITIDGIYWDEIHDPITNECYFIRYDKTNQSYKKEKVLEDKTTGRKYYPICMENSWVDESFVKLPSEPIDYISFQNLVGEIEKFIHKYADVTNEFRRIYAYFIIASWFEFKMNVAPTIEIISPYSKGKSRIGDVGAAVCYHTISLVDPSSAALIRLMSKFKGTVFVNENNTSYSNSDEYYKVINIYCSGFERGKPVARCEGDNFDVVPKDPFGFKIFASYTGFSDGAMSSRCIRYETFKTERNDIPIDLNATTEFSIDSMRIRNLILDFVLKNCDVEFTPMYTGDCIGIEHRTAQCFLAIRYLAVFDKSVLEFLKKTEAQHEYEQLLQNIESYDGEIFHAFLNTIKKEDSLNVSAKHILEFLNHPPKMTTTKISRSIKKSTGIDNKPKRINNELRKCYDIDEKKFTLALQRYVLPDDRKGWLDLYKKLNVEDESPIEQSPKQQPDKQKLDFYNCETTEEEYLKGRKKDDE